uniref:Transcription termination factor 1, tandem duplicate 1 n=1 Tax=Astyanax mexicanus TaxID=7994 RepID=W5KQQ7_ASTMX
MGKNKDKKAKRTSDDFLEMSPNSSYVPENPQQFALSTDTDSSVVGSPRRLDMFTYSTEKSKKKQKKMDLAAQECENKSSEFQTEGEHEHGKKPKKRHKSRDCETPSNNPAELYITDMVNGSAAETSHHEEPARKKKKKDKLRQTEETVAPAESESDVSRKKKKKKRSRDEVEEMNVTLKSDENEMMTDKRTGDSEKKKKKKKEKDHQIQMFESAASSAQSVLENGFDASTETGEKQAENIQVKKKEEKKKRHKEKQNLSQILGSPTTAAVQSVQQNRSTDLQETEAVNVSTGPKESPSKKGKKNKATPKNGGLKTRQTQTITPKTEQTEEVSVNERVQIGTGFGTKKNNKKERVSKEIDQGLLEELKQFVPNVGSRVQADINKMIQYDLPRYKEFQKKGIPLNHGRFTMAENEILKKNVEDFLALTGIDSGTKLFYSQRFEEEKSAINKLKKNHKFFEAIAKGIPRSCHDIYTRGRKIFDDSTCKGRFTQTEIDQLCKLQTLHGNNWKKISELTGRSAVSLEKRYSQITKRLGVWSQKELQRLLGAVREYIISEVQPRPSNIRSLQVSREMLYKGLPWRNISEKVKTRSWIKCREKWMSILAAKMSSGASGEYKRTTNEGRIMLIKAMYQMQAEDVADVDWDQLSALFGDVPPCYVQKKWNRLKVCFVPNWQSKCFADTIDFLYHKVLPCFESNGLYHPDHDILQLKETQAKNFLFTDIFPDISDQDDYDDDDDDDEEEE